MPVVMNLGCGIVLVAWFLLSERERENFGQLEMETDQCVHYTCLRF